MKTLIFLVRVINFIVYRLSVKVSVLSYTAACAASTPSDDDVYFDAHSSVGYPTPDKWIPLEYKEGRKTDLIHDYPKKRQNRTCRCYYWNCSINGQSCHNKGNRCGMNNPSVITELNTCSFQIMCYCL